MIVISSENLMLYQDNMISNDFARYDSSTLLIRRLKTHHIETYLHSARVSIYTLLITKAMGFNQRQQEIMYRSAWLHDIGKLYIPRHVLDDRENMKNRGLMIEHCARGKQIVKQWGAEGWVDTDMIEYHHENLDGTGYYGQTWKRLSQSARIIRVADSYDKLTDLKPNPFTMQEAFEELYRWSDVIYDESVVEQFYRLLKQSNQTFLLPHSR